MTFKEKIDKILKTNKFKINSVYGLEQYIGAGPGAIKKYYKKDGEPGRGTIKKIIDGVGINPEWWDGESDSIYLEKPTPGRKEDTLDAKMSELQDEHIRLLREKVVMLEKEKSVLLKELEGYRSGAK
jgi:hypothetical protein